MSSRPKKVNELPDKMMGISIGLWMKDADAYMDEKEAENKRLLRIIRHARRELNPAVNFYKDNSASVADAILSAALTEETTNAE